MINDWHHRHRSIDHHRLGDTVRAAKQSVGATSHGHARG